MESIDVSIHNEPETMDCKHSSYVDNEWWRGHFSGLLLDLWEAIVPREQAARDVDFLQAECRLAAGARILDVPCGDGRVALELARRGYQVVGVDISAGLLRDAQRQAEACGWAVEWREADMRSLPWEEAFDAAFCWGDSFGYLDDTGNQEFLCRVQRALKPGGRWAMEMQMLAEVLLPRFRAEEAGVAGGMRVRVQRVYDPRHSRLFAKYWLARDGNEEVKMASYRIYTCGEICRMLERAGFVVERLLGGDGEPFHIGSDRLRVVAAKKPTLE